MTTAILLLSHGAIGAVALLTLLLRPPWRARVLTGLCLVGAGFGVALVVSNGSSDDWRTAELGGTSALVGISIATAWLSAALVSGRRGSVLSCALIGVASSAMALAVTNKWAVPMLLFWLCSSLAIAALAAHQRSGLWVWAVLFASDAALVAALVGSWAETRSWVLPEALEGWPFYVLLLSAALRAGVMPATGAWSLSREAAPAIPLLVGGGFSLLRIGLGDADPWAGVALFILALAMSGAVLLARRRAGGIPAAAAPAIAVMLGLAVIAPSALIAAGLAAVVSAGTAAMWAFSADEAAPDRVIALTAIPPSLAFLAAVNGVVAAVGRTAGAEEVIDKVPWTLALLLGPLVLTANVAVAVRIALSLPNGSGWIGRARKLESAALAVLLSRLLLAFAVVATLLPGDWLGIRSPFAQWEERRTILLGVALVLGAVATWFAARRPTPSAEHGVSSSHPRFSPAPWLADPPSGVLAVRLLVGAALVFAVATIAVVGWFVFEGLRLGFL
ncbi:MAG: hypothetical protein M3198_07305 [Actinomycetota bacterium]|nr:hypothetical protein [Actinomycetota bacterium]